MTAVTRALIRLRLPESLDPRRGPYNARVGLLLDTMRTVEFLAGESDERIWEFMILGKSIELPKGHVIWRAGRPPETLVIPVTGEAKTATRSTEGREFIDRFLASGECLGLASALDGMPHPTDAEVVRPGEFFIMPRAGLLRYLDAHPDIQQRAAQMIGQLYRRSLKEREDVALRPVPQRVAEFLLESACVRQADGAKVLVKSTQAEIAARLGTVREVVARIFADFSQRGLIERTDAGIFISDWDGLAAEAGRERESDEEKSVRAGRKSAAQVRTARFFLPMYERRMRNRGEDEAAQCREHLGDLSLCRDRGCPGAAAEDAKRRAPK